MGMHHSTYFAYGIHVTTDRYAWEESEHADEALSEIQQSCPDIRTLSAGDYDRDHFFLVTKSHEVKLGTFEHVTPSTATPQQITDWDRQLLAAAIALGYTDTSAPGWLVVPDCS
ncbi:hypothetical protein ABZ883_14685 [Streptomyces sp. NPDC046977]|uniref:hypothetical protein n=1 Tax=Streptomyces sp. NPDC046977 TaxID=3154703 RepID=UPI0033EBBE1A